MASNVGICNMALSILGADRITSLGDNSENARRLNAIYEDVVKDMLRLHPWNFAIGRAKLAQLSAAPAFEYDLQYQLPVDCLRVISVTDGTNIITDFKVEGRKLLTDYTTVYIKYIVIALDPNQYDSQFIFVLAARLAADLAYAITNNSTAAKNAYELYTARLENAKGTDGQESNSIEEIDKDSWTIDERA